MAKQEQPAEEKKSPGQILKEIRTSKGIALETIHNATKIPLDALKAIEEGYRVRTLSPFYMKGFIKMYAEYLGVDVGEILEDYHKEHLPGPATTVYPGDVLEKKIKKIFTRERQQWLVKIAAGLVALFLLSKIGGCLFGKPKTSRPQVKKAALTAAPKKVTRTEAKKKTEKSAEKPKVRLPEPVEKKEPVKAAIPAAPPQKPAEQPQKAGPVKDVRLTIRTRKQGWLQVKVDGNLVFQSTIKEGAVETWEADDRIELSGKNIHNLEFEVNGKVLGNLGRADRSARRVVITKDGLKVIQ